MNRITIIIIVLAITLAIITATLMIHPLKQYTNTTQINKQRQETNSRVPETIKQLLQQIKQVKALNTTGSYIVTTTTGKTYIIYNVTKITLYNYLKLLVTYAKYVYSVNRELYSSILSKVSLPIGYSLTDLVIFNNGTIKKINATAILQKLNVYASVVNSNVTNKSALFCFRFVPRNNKSYTVKYGVLVVTVWKYFIPVAARTYILLNLDTYKTYCLRLVPQYNFTRFLWRIRTIVSNEDLQRKYARYVISISYIPVER